MAKRRVGEINAGSMADIAFLLLIFFLVTTTMDVDKGITRRLPPPVEDPDQIVIEKRNVLEVLVNANDWLMVNNNRMDINMLREEAKNFLSVNYSDNPELPETKEKNIPLLGGPIMVSKGVISLKNDRGTSYGMYIQVQNELTAAVNELRDELAMEKFNKKYSDMNPKKPTDEDMINAIREAIPVSISEAEPENIGGNK